ncbi:hypothetical protein LSCM1_07930 [Leishmania martiniquensis]|uniref:Uncharacterized protein n=1 Tax=Leishmania martiniquensis TaxID=1580590 RepID=A0A836HI70_9TRYP|nr:hypothetical protein LSCM1_07930 [Leishmania martiniquensis]
MGPPKASPSGFHRGQHDASAASLLHNSGLNFTGLILESADTVQQLLSIARGDFSSIIAAEVPNAAQTAGDGAAKSGVADASGASVTSFSSSATLARTHSGAGEARPTVSTTVTDVAKACSAYSSPPSRAMRVGNEVRALNELLGGPDDASALTNAEASAFYLTAIVAQALRLEDYWVHLGHQIEVDQYVEFIQYCARQGFAALKTVHLLGWWRQYRSLVRGDAEAPAGAAITPLLLSDGNPQKSAPPSHFQGGGAGCASAGGGEHGSAGSSSSSHGREGSLGPKVSKKGRRASVLTVAEAPLSVEPGGHAGASTRLSAAAAPPLRYASRPEALLGELQRFVQWELEHEWAWRQVPRDAPLNAATSLSSPREAILSGGNRRTAAGASATGAAKLSRADKVKMQQLQQQQEMEAEEQRLALLAAMPPENIFLTKEEIDGFLRFAVEEDLLSHAALHGYVASHAQQPTSTLARSARSTVCFSVLVETPMPVLPLREATRLSALSRRSGSIHASLSPLPRDGAVGADAATSGTASALQSPSTTSSTGRGKTTSGRSRAHSKRPFKSTSKEAAAATTEAAAAAASIPPTEAELRVALTGIEALRAEQAKEAAACRAAHEEELAQTAARQRAAQHAEDVHLFFENASTNTAVQCVYASIEDAIAERQRRILQRVVALERALGLTAPSAEVDRLGAAGAEDSGGAAAAAPKPTSVRGASSSGGTSTGKAR